MIYDPYDPEEPYENPAYSDPNEPAGPTPPPEPGATPPPQRSQLAQMAARMRGGAGYGGDASTMAIPSAAQDPESPLMEDEKKKYTSGSSGQSAQSSGASSGDIMSLLGMLA